MLHGVTRKKKQLSESEDVSVNNEQTRLELKLKRMIELKRIRNCDCNVKTTGGQKYRIMKGDKKGKDQKNM